MDVVIDTKATLQRFSDAEITVSDWCAARGFKRDRFYSVVNNSTMKYRTAIVAKKLFTALKKEGLLVLAPSPDDYSKPIHVAHNISSPQK